MHSQEGKNEKYRTEQERRQREKKIFNMYTHTTETIQKMWNKKRKVYAPKENGNERWVTRENKKNVSIVPKWLLKWRVCGSLPSLKEGVWTGGVHMAR